MKNTLFLLLIVLTASLTWAEAPKYRVIKVHTPLNMGNLPPDNTAVNDYYVTIGRENGMEIGALLNVYRTRQIEGEENGVSISTRVFVGQLRVVQVEDKYCISRVVALAGSATTHQERSAILVGDYVLPVFVIQDGQLFAKGSATLLSGATRYFEEVAVFIKNNNPSRVLVEGHTDNDGTPAYNLKLSEMRAAAVRDYLVSQAEIDFRILYPVGCGKSRPIAPNDIPDRQAMNHRVEIIIER